MHFLKQNTEHKQQLKSKVLDVAKHLFLKKGVKAVKMDDISGVLSISKRTLYEIYGNKEDLLLEVLHLMQEECMEKFSKVCKESNNVMDDFISFCKFQTEFMKSLSPAFITDIQKYPKVHEYMKAHSNESKQHSMSFFRRGVEEGYFLPFLDYRLICDMLEIQRQHIISSQLYCTYSFEELFYNLTVTVLRGFCTTKGIAQLDSFIHQKYQ
ncbi:MAG: TetR/AcrR family transcriptional regulator [Prevotella sp.]